MFHVKRASTGFDSPGPPFYGPSVLPELAAELSAELELLKARDRYRSCPPVAGPTRDRLRLDGRTLINFASNDYLGLASHPRLIEAATAAAHDSGFGAGASRLVCGDLPAHRALEAALERFFDHPAALAFPTGYQTNLGVITALAGPNDLIVSDAANHASIIDACRLSRARIAIYPHRDAEAARRALADTASFRRRVLVTESVFSMDGDVAPLADLADIARHARAALIVDEAHAVGAVGPGGRGLCAAAGVVPDVLIGTLGKTFGASGGFVVGSTDLRSYLVNRARPFLFATALPPPVAAAATAAIELASGTPGDRLRARLASHIAFLTAALADTPFARPSTAIFPIVLGSDRAALEGAAALRSRGIFAQAIRPPTVPEGRARLRITLSAAHATEDVALLAGALRSLQPLSVSA
jgi:8-amino-7-oxononanoate synthase